ncbi:MAG: hypothetical protein AAFN41_07215, partial [Planctomycetota bacterium]
PDIHDPTFDSYPILATSGSIDGIDLLLDQSGFPSTSFFTGLGVTNDGAGGLNPIDIMAAVTPSTRPDLAFNLLTFAGFDDSSGPGLWGSTALPTSIDAASIRSGGYTIEAPGSVNGSGQLRTIITDVQVTLIPAPASSLALGGAMLLVARRRR